MKLIIQIPCFNEAESLPTTLAALPQRVNGCDVVETLVIDDGSTDDTVNIARKLGVNHVHCLNGHQGLAKAFISGLIAAVECGADVIVNTDADNQYDARDIEALMKPILANKADMVVGARPIASMRHFSTVKRLLQLGGSFIVRMLSGADVLDAASGFRAFSREAALRLNVFCDFTYTIETILQARINRLRVVSVPVRVNGATRPSRLFRSSLIYVLRSGGTMLHTFGVYRPTWIIGFATFLMFFIASILGCRFWNTMAAEGEGHLESGIACAVFLLCSVFMAAIGMVARLQEINRQLLEETRYLLRSQVANGHASSLLAIVRTDCRQPSCSELPRVG
jgi:glycosyltransferase involved in cell wall biosynthesis